MEEAEGSCQVAVAVVEAWRSAKVAEEEGQGREGAVGGSRPMVEVAGYQWPGEEVQLVVLEHGRWPGSVFWL